MACMTYEVQLQFNNGDIASTGIQKYENMILAISIQLLDSPHNLAGKKVDWSMPITKTGWSNILHEEYGSKITQRTNMKYTPEIG